MKKMMLSLGCLALLASLSTFASADAITFSFVNARPAVTINASGLSAGPASVLLVSDSNLNEYFSFLGTAKISTGAASSYTASGGNLSAQFLPGPGIEVEVDSASCTGGAHPGICLQGILNSNGQYTALAHGTGSFQALYTVTYVSPYVPALFGDATGWQATGSDSLTTSANIFRNGSRTDSATLGGGSITYQTPVPEPGTLLMLGSGMIGLAGVIRRKMR
ncbi:MAG: PEP-CTERM sorting domain-containing protein [Candidatus Korobacteraceae bacterium]